MKLVVLLPLFIMMFTFSSCDSPTSQPNKSLFDLFPNNGLPEFASEAERLGKLNKNEMLEEFARLGSVEGAPGPIPIGESEGKSGLFMFDQGIVAGLNNFQQDVAYKMVWAGKVFHNDDSRGCNPEKGGTFWLDNRLKGPFKGMYSLEGECRGNVYYSDESWIGDGKRTIVIDYEPTPSLSFVHDEIRLAKWDKKTNLATYFGIMWVEIGGIRLPFAYFIPDQVTPYPCK